MKKKLAVATVFGLVLSVATVLSPGQAAPMPGQPAMSAGAAVDLRVGTLNALSVALDKNSGMQKPWAQRRPVIVNHILRERLDVLGLQEVHPAKTYAPRMADGPNQYMDLVAGLNGRGARYAVTNKWAFNCENSVHRTNCKPVNREASHSTRILYNTRTVALVKHGGIQYAAQAGGNNPNYLAWAILRSKANGRQFLFTSTHLETRDAGIRRQQWAQQIREINRLRGRRPVIAVGDYNAHKFSPEAAEFLPAMKRAGYGDALNQEYRVNPLRSPRAQRTINGWLNSFNHKRRDVSSYSFDENRRKTGNMLDWIFAQNNLRVLEYKVVLNFNRRTLQVNGVLPSDHNMLRATLRLPAA